ncbi:hypothetical protein [Falsirhodobacter xinxiangensis]|uniref:hypothetical protein n=1 Tax=Falsirhodobacter xinxiangensis TaxID=2530049 RepID=UPI0010AAF723|nr:hypothetical protein [Rhodobacter xinxiangensis]
MTKRGDRHSRRVAFLKVVLPLVALVLLSTIFLVSRTIDPDDAIPYAQVDVEGRAMDPRMTLPTWSGVTEDGAALAISAAEARPPTDSAAATATALRALLTTPDGVKTEAQATSGTLDGNTLRLDGAVRLTNSAGYDIRAPGLVTTLDRTGISSTGALTAQAPMGQITAGGMTLGEDDAKPGNYRLDFTGGVKLIYTPPKQP